MREFKHAVALTGGIATGKSSAASIFSKLGLEIIDADKVAHDILDQQTGAVARMFGSRCLSDGRVNRKVLGSIVFTDRKKLAALEKLLHPLIHEEISSKARVLDKEYRTYLIDIPLFFEKQGYSIPRSILVYAPRKTQIERLMSRENYSEEEATIRIDTQMDIELKKELSTFVIDNTGDMKHLESECRRVKNLL